jgi:choice-of-anchor B domain-containing protein
MLRLRHLLPVIVAAITTASVAAAQSFRVEGASLPSMIGFGAAIAFAGQDVIVGRPGMVIGFPMPAGQTGAVHVFRRGPQGWAEAGAVTAEGVGETDGFGTAIAIAENLMAVGAPRTSENRGAVYVFERDPAGNWSERAKLVPGDVTPDAHFGSSIAIGANAILVGAPGTSEGQGAVVVFSRGQTAGSWTETARLSGSGIGAGDAFGTALGISNDAVLVGAPGPGGGLFSQGEGRAGQAFVFRRGSNGAWTEEAKLAVTGVDRLRGLGRVAAIAGDDVYLPFPMADQGAGTIYHFRRQAGTWTQVGTIGAATPERSTFFGASIAVDGSEMVVGAPYSNQGGGAIHMLRRDTAGTWAATQKMTAEAVGLGTQLGTTAAIRDGVAIGGAPGADFFEGKAILYTRAGTDGQYSETATLIDHTPPQLAEVRGGSEVKCGSGTAGEFPCQQVDLVSFVPVSALGGKRGIMVNDMWGWTDTTTGREFAIVGRFDATVFVEVTDPSNPVYLGELPLHEGARPNLWRDIKVYKNHAYIVSDGAGPHGMQVFDLTQLREVQGAPKTFTETAHYDGIASAHNIAIDESSGFAYTIGNSMGGETCGGGPHMIDIREPTKPTFAGCWADTTTGNARTGYTHDAQCTVYQGPDQRYAGRQLCFNASETAIGIADVTDKANPKRISSASYPNVAYAHQGWLSADHRYFFLNDEGDELSGTAPKTRTLVFDVTDLEDPVVAKEFFGNTPASDHNLYVKDRYMYQSNYVAGLRVIDISDPDNPVEVGFFDTVPFGEDQAGFAGTWSNYPYFKSGVVAVTSMREGLFLVRFRPQQVVP